MKFLYVKIFLIVLWHLSYSFIETNEDNWMQRCIFQENLHTAVAAMIKSFPLHYITIAFDIHTEILLIQNITLELSSTPVAIVLFNITLETQQEKYLNFLKGKYIRYEQLATLFLCNNRLSEHILIEIYFNNFIRTNLYFLFYWGKNTISQSFLDSMHEAMKIVVITNPRPNAYRILYNQVKKYRNTEEKQYLEMVNWWNEMDGLSKHPTLPSVYDFYKNFYGRELIVPVIHKPPWHFINYKDKSLPSCSLKDDETDQKGKMLEFADNSTIFNEENNVSFVDGGRDHKLLNILGQKLNFKIKYCDPPERTQGVTFSENGTFDGALGLIWKREADLFLGDVALTLDRFQVVEFSFITLADSGAFITHAPSKLNEALALIRPFHWQVWPVIFAILMLSGPILFALVTLPNDWHSTFLVKSKRKLFFDCYWYSISLFLKQTIKFPFDSDKVRFFTIVVSISATYIIADMYSANLTSLLAKPGREKTINDLYELENAMIKRFYRLYVEKHSSSHSLLENGTGIYKRLWRLMNQQQSFVVDSVEEGVMLVKESNSNNVLLGGRETLFFDIQRYGAHNFHLSQKLNTAYSAIAFQVGCPYLENINSILIALFEGGILTKMTENEYAKLGRKRSIVNEGTIGAITPVGKKETRSVTKAAQDNEKLQPISLKMLQGAFYLLFFGCMLSGLILALEIFNHKFKYRQHKNHRAFDKCKCRKIIRITRLKIRKIVNYIRMRYRQFISEAAIEILPYLD